MPLGQAFGHDYDDSRESRRCSSRSSGRSTVMSGSKPSPRLPSRFPQSTPGATAPPKQSLLRRILSFQWFPRHSHPTSQSSVNSTDFDDPAHTPRPHTSLQFTATSGSPTDDPSSTGITSSLEQRPASAFDKRIRRATIPITSAFPRNPARRAVSADFYTAPQSKAVDSLRTLASSSSSSTSPTMRPIARLATGGGPESGPVVGSAPASSSEAFHGLRSRSSLKRSPTMRLEVVAETESESAAAAEVSKMINVSNIPALPRSPPPALSSLVARDDDTFARPLITAPHTKTSAKEAALDIWTGTGKIVENEKAVAWLVQEDPYHESVLKYYMKLYDFGNMDPLQSLRTLCGNIYTRAETTQLDRFLEAFAARWCSTNPHRPFSDPDIIHSVAYSLLLLNTDLHIADLSPSQRMTRPQFVKNTLDSICQMYRKKLRRHYHARRVSANSQDLPNSSSSTNSESNKASALLSSSTTIHSLTFEVQMQMEKFISYWTGQLKEMYTSVKHSRILQPDRYSDLTALSSSSIHHPDGDGPLYSDSSLQRRTSTVRSNSRLSNFSSSSTVFNLADMFADGKNNHKHIHSLTSLRPENKLASTRSVSGTLTSLSVVSTTLLEIDQKPLSKEEGFMILQDETAALRAELEVMSKHNSFMRRLNRFKDMYVVLTSNAFNLFSLGRSAATLLHKGDEKWVYRSHSIFAIPLRYVLARLDGVDHDLMQTNKFNLCLPSQKDYIVRTHSNEEAAKWVDEINYRAALVTRIPLCGNVTSVDYGWGACLEEYRKNPGKPLEGKINIAKWKPDPLPEMDSNTSEVDQLHALQHFIPELAKVYAEHANIRLPMIKALSAQHKGIQQRAITNWQNRLHYLNEEMAKFRTYTKVIEKRCYMKS
ncbi:guanyl-nucleotide exchange factor [Schizosaccharomyces japonicus yFS275]|uniref:Guanyl-nucleotide exchange factor n=1 Tax=Schizosaccharomyces japonicus (strain yFS275 / FY16936) TaxID=402676 RepID=B6JV16_SCHJY|nr:guanyl-nucleotide exchange factor [Schizosaccharomyces japonicus yFS275]EEB05217.2 guanyl-nucleotide exchange factor [Schizosaccharomyces japonicus yFS275]